MALKAGVFVATQIRRGGHGVITTIHRAEPTRIRSLDELSGALGV